MPNHDTKNIIFLYRKKYWHQLSSRDESIPEQYSNVALDPILTIILGLTIGGS